MKTKTLTTIGRLMLGLVLMIGLIGCAQFPNVACESWHHEGNYGPVTTQYDAKQVTRQEDGSLRIASYTGNVKVLGGYGVTDTVQGLVLSPAAAKQPAVTPTKDIP